MNFKDDTIDCIVDLTIKASKKIIEVYDSKDLKIQNKKDNTPLTLADKLSENIIVEGLTELFPTIPLVSEENQMIPFNQRKEWEYFWLVDPLDGTKE